MLKHLIKFSIFIAEHNKCNHFNRSHISHLIKFLDDLIKAIMVITNVYFTCIIFWW